MCSINILRIHQLMYGCLPLCLTDLEVIWRFFDEVDVVYLIATVMNGDSDEWSGEMSRKLPFY
jgi:hypothetical protein